MDSKISGVSTMICDECDSIIPDDEETTPLLLVTGCVDVATEQYYTCPLCGHRQINNN